MNKNELVVSWLSNSAAYTESAHTLDSHYKKLKYSLYINANVSIWQRVVVCGMIAGSSALLFSPLVSIWCGSCWCDWSKGGQRWRHSPVQLCKRDKAKGSSQGAHKSSLSRTWNCNQKSYPSYQQRTYFLFCPSLSITFHVMWNFLHLISPFSTNPPAFSSNITFNIFDFPTPKQCCNNRLVYFPTLLLQFINLTFSHNSIFHWSLI